MSKAKRIISSLAKSFAIIIVALFVIALSFLAWPGLVFNNFALQALRSVAGYMDIPVSWETASLAADSISFTQKRIRAEFTGLDAKFGTVEIKLESTSIEVRLAFNFTQPFLYGIGPIVVNKSILKIDQTSASTGPSEPLDLQSIEDYFVVREVLPVRITDLNWSVHGPESIIKGSADLILEKMAPDSYELNVSSTFAGDSQIARITLDAHYANDHLRAKLDAKMKTGQSVRVDANFQPLASNRRSFSLSAIFQNAKDKFALKTQGSVSKTKVNISATADYLLVAERPIKGRISDCSLQLTSPNMFRDQINGVFNCESKVNRAYEKWERKVNRPLLPADFAIQVSSEFRVELEERSRVVHSLSKLTLMSEKGSTVGAAGSVTADVSIAFDDSKEPRRFEIKGDGQVEIPQFQLLVNELKATPYEIFAPFHQLNGPVKCETKTSHRWQDTETLKWPIACGIKLKSAEQEIDIDSLARISLNTNRKQAHMDVNVEVSINSIVLTVPDIDLSSRMPKLVPDKRIRRATLKKEKESQQNLNLTYDARIRTTRANAIQIINNITQGPLPFETDMHLSNSESINGKIGIGKAKLVFLKRTARSEYLNFTFPRNSSEIELDGKIILDNPNYIVQVVASGTLKSPRFTLLTDPPLPQNEAVGILLYGERLDNLDDTNKRSASDASAAMTDNAIGLVSMYYLASTPVESIGYDPQSGLVSANFRLKSGAVLTVGRDADASSIVGLQKSLGRNWRIETTIRSADDSGNEARGGAFLKWGKRY